MFRRVILTVAVGVGVAGKGTVARADVVVLSPVAAGQFSNVDDIRTLRTVSDSFGVSWQIYTPDITVYSGVLEYSLASLPADAVVTRATITCNLLDVSDGLTFKPPPPVGPTPPPFMWTIYMYDGKDGQVTLADVSRSPEVFAATETLKASSSPSLHTTTLINNVYFLNQRSFWIPSGYLGIELDDTGEAWTGATVDLVVSPALTLTYTVPEPASVGMLGVGILMLSRRRR